MFRNRSLRVKVVKDDPSTIVDTSPIDYNRIIETIAKSTVVVVVAYVGADTLRQALVHVAKTGIQAS
jgi:hypothetical protein